MEIELCNIKNIEPMKSLMIAFRVEERNVN